MIFFFLFYSKSDLEYTEIKIHLIWRLCRNPVRSVWRNRNHWLLQWITLSNLQYICMLSICFTANQSAVRSFIIVLTANHLRKNIIIKWCELFWRRKMGAGELWFYKQVKQHERRRQTFLKNPLFFQVYGRKSGNKIKDNLIWKDSAELKKKRVEMKTPAPQWRIDTTVNIPNMPTLHGRLPGDKGGFRWWWWCERTYSRRLGALQDTPRAEALKRPEQSEPVWGVGGV